MIALDQIEVPEILNRPIRLCKEGNLKACETLLVWTNNFPRQEIVTGGIGDGRTDDEFTKDQLLKGLSIELEHTNNPWIAKEISKDHLVEESKAKDISPKFSVYYNDLEKMEDAWKDKKERWKTLSKIIL